MATFREKTARSVDRMFSFIVPICNFSKFPFSILRAGFGSDCQSCWLISGIPYECKKFGTILPGLIMVQTV